MRTQTVLSLFLFLFLLVLACCIAVAGVYTSYRDFYTDSSNSEDVSFIVNKGDNLEKVARALKDKKLIPSVHSFRLWTRVYGNDTKIKSGEYNIPAFACPYMIMNILTSGDVIVHKITLIEGLTTAEILDILNANEQLVNDAGIEFATFANGTLLPSTYHFSLGDSTTSVLNRMKEAFTQKSETLWENRDKNLPFENLFQAITLASLVEKEAALPEERPLIASVFINRLKRGMKLQSDPTVIFALTGGKNTMPRHLYYKDLEIDSPYNTYKYKGLPPAPICNVGLDSLNAVLHPAKTNYLYFVVDNDKPKAHIFSNNFKEHHVNATNFRKQKNIERKQQKAKANQKLNKDQEQKQN